jgi:cytochrome c biogenesis protein CcmG/thiol:disulfide interchange protein DsbE
MNTPANMSPQRMWRVLGITAGALLFVMLIVLLAWGVRRSGDADRDVLPSALIGKPAPAFDLPLLHDPSQRLKLSDLRGQPFVLNVWGSWCPECRVEHPVITRLVESRRIQVFGYNLKDEPGDALGWLAQFGDPYRAVIVDYDGGEALNWGIYGAPETFLVDGEGVVRWKHVGALDEDIINGELLPLLDKIEGKP